MRLELEELSLRNDLEVDVRHAVTIAEVLGGRCTGDATSGGLEILLPRR